MMGSPAQVCDDDNAQNNAVVTNSESISSTSDLMTVVPEQSNNSFLKSRPWLKHECEKRIDASTVSGPKRMPKTDKKLKDIGPIGREPIDPRKLEPRGLKPKPGVVASSAVKVKQEIPFSPLGGRRKPIVVGPQRNPGPGSSVLVIQNGPNPNTPFVASPAVNSNNNRPDAAERRKPIKYDDLGTLRPTDPPRSYDR